MAVVDSVAALVPRSEIEGDMGDAQMGSQARLMSQALRKLTSAISKSMTSVIFINQIRHKIGVMFGNPETTTGGNALKFYASMRLDIRKITAIKQGDEVIGVARPGQGGEKQAGPALQRGGIRHHLRPGHLPGRRPPGPGRGPGPHRQRAAPGSATAPTASARAGRTPRPI